MQLPGALLGASSKKKSPPRKNFLIFQEMKFYSSNIKKFLNIKIFSYTSRNGTPNNYNKAFFLIL